MNNSYKCHQCTKEAEIHMTEMVRGLPLTHHLCEGHARELLGFRGYKNKNKNSMPLPETHPGQLSIWKRNKKEFEKFCIKLLGFRVAKTV